MRSTPRRAGVRHVEWPTWAVVVAVYGGWLVTTALHAAIPIWLLLPLGAWLIAWHGSLQHEAVHGHPTGRPVLDAAIAGSPLSLWLPFSLYRESHLAHHATEALTCPRRDPESFLVDDDRWRRAGRVERGARWILTTAAGRLLIGPIWVVACTWGEQLHAALREDRRVVIRWIGHAFAVGVVLAWLVGVCRMSLLEYVLAFVYPGLALTLLRSFAEHAPAVQPGHRTAVVESGTMLSLLFLNNNLHVVHHERPGLPWYALPRIYARERDRVLRRNGGRLHRGYGSVLARHLFRPAFHPAAQRGPRLRSCSRGT